MSAQAQDSLTEQIVRVVTWGIANGQYDAVDWINNAYFRGAAAGNGGARTAPAVPERDTGAAR